MFDDGGESQKCSTMGVRVKSVSQSGLGVCVTVDTALPVPLALAVACSLTARCQHASLSSWSVSESLEQSQPLALASVALPVAA